MTLHSTAIGGSSARRLMHCPGSHAVAAKLPRPPSSDYANEGTMLHSVVDLALDRDPAELIGHEEAGHVFNLDLLDEMIKPALEMFDKFPIDDFVTEARVEFQEKALEGCFGTVDVLGWNEDRSTVYVVDWKFGRGVEVRAKNGDDTPNEQLLFYAAAARQHHPDWFPPDVAIMLVIIQPAWGYSSVEVSHADLDQFETALKVAAGQLDDAAAPVMAGDWCKFCPAKPACPLMRAMAEKAEAAASPKVEDLPRLLEMAEFLESWTRDVRKLAHDQLDQGHQVEGWKLVNKRATRQWIDPEAAEARMRGIKKLKIADVYNMVFKSPAQMEKVLKAHKYRGYERLLEEHVESRSSGTTLAREDDKRQAVPGSRMGAVLSDAMTRSKIAS